MIGGKKIAEGGYGCVFHPTINCKAKETNDKKFISKLQFSDFSSKNEINIGEYLNNKFKNDKDNALINNFAPVVSSCYVDKSKFKKDIINDCKVLQKFSSSKEISVIKIRYIDMDIFDKYILKNVDKNFIILTLMSSYNHLLDSIGKLIDVFIVHFDLKGPNVVFDIKRNVPIIIDFGLSFNINDINSESIFNYFYVYAPQYYIWPLEVHYLNYILHVKENPTNNELKDICNKFTKNNSALNGFSSKFINLYGETCYKVLLLYNKLSFADKRRAVLQSWSTWDNYSLSVMYLKILNAFVLSNNLKSNSIYEKFITLLLLNIHPNFKKRKTIKFSKLYFNNIINNEKRNLDTFTNFTDASKDNIQSIRNNLTNILNNDTKLKNEILYKEKSSY